MLGLHLSASAGSLFAQRHKPEDDEDFRVLDAFRWAYRPRLRHAAESRN